MATEGRSLRIEQTITMGSGMGERKTWREFLFTFEGSGKYKRFYCIVREGNQVSWAHKEDSDVGEKLIEFRWDAREGRDVIEWMNKVLSAQEAIDVMEEAEKFNLD